VKKSIVSTANITILRVLYMSKKQMKDILIA